MKIAVCSLSEFTYVAEFVDAAMILSERHEVVYFLGYRSPSALELLESRGIRYEVLLDHPPLLQGPAKVESTEMLFTEFFFKQAGLVLPALLKRLEAWGAEAVSSHLRDFAGVNAAEILGIPLVSFGSHATPVRTECLDPPFGGGLARTSSHAQRSMMWRLHHEFNHKLDQHYNRLLRFPHGLNAVQGCTTHSSTRLVLLSLIASLGNTHSLLPDHVHYVGSLYSRMNNAADEWERTVHAQIRERPHPRIFVSLGTTYGSGLLPKCIDALADFQGTVIASGTDTRSAKHLITAPFFKDVDAVLKACDAVVTICGGKTVMDALAHGLPMIGLPCQGEQKEIALALAEHGAAALPCLRKWDARNFKKAVMAVSTAETYRLAAAQLQTESASAGGAEKAVSEIENLLSKTSSFA